MLALPKLAANIDVLEQLEEIAFPGQITAIARYPDEVDILKRAGATTVFDIYSEAGTGFAEYVKETIRSRA